jgi:prepilin-type N-terminal cleavage/methylation domain-containing protein
MKRSPQSGFTMVETAIAMAILAFVMANFIGSFVNQAHSQVRSRLLLQAADLARQAHEVAYNLSSNTNNWGTDIGNLSYTCGTLNPCHPEFNFSPPSVSIVPNEEIIEGFYKRSMMFETVCRDDTDGNPTNTPPCTNDENVIKLTVAVKIDHPSSSIPVPITITSYLFNPKSL